MSAVNWAAIERVFDGALDLAPEERETFVAQADVSPQERKHALRLIRANELATGFLTHSPRPFRERAPLAPETRIGDWRVLEPIGAGGMGSVYKVVRDTGEYEQFGALKLLQLTDDGFAQRFAQERQIAAALNHASIARLIDGGASDDGQAYMVMDLVPGETLIEYAQQRRLSERDRLRLFLKLCAAVAYAHGQFVLHRDIKPSNVLVTEGATLKLLDFGVAAFLSDDAEDAAAPLTLAYAAPEQRDGGAVSTATDVYALGVVLGELLSGARCVPPSQSLPPDLAAIVDRCTAQDPGGRYQSVDALAADVRRYLGSEPVLARGGGVGYRIGRFLRRYRTATAITAVALVGLASALVLTLAAYDRSEMALTQARESREQWEFEARTTRGLRRAILQMYGVQTDGGEPIASSSIDERLMAISNEAEIAAQQGDLQQAHDMFAIAGHFMRRFDHAKAIDVFERLLAADVKDPVLRVEAGASLAWSLEAIGREEEAVALAHEVAKDPYLQRGPYYQTLTRVERIIANASDDEDSKQRVIEQLHEAIAYENSLPLEDRFYTRWYYNQLGFMYLHTGAYEDAAQAFVQEFYHARDLGTRSLEMVTTATNAAQGQVYVLRSGASPLEYLPDYLPYVDGQIGEDSPRHGFMRSIMADAALLVGDATRAQQEAERAIALLQGDRSYRGGWVFQAHMTRLRALLAQGDVPRAQSVLAALRAAADGPDVQTATEVPPWRATARCMAGLGAALLEAGRDPQTAGMQYAQAVAQCQGGASRLRAPHQIHADAFDMS